MCSQWSARTSDDQSRRDGVHLTSHSQRLEVATMNGATELSAINVVQPQPPIARRPDPELRDAVRSDPAPGGQDDHAGARQPPLGDPWSLTRRRLSVDDRGPGCRELAAAHARIATRLACRREVPPVEVSRTRFGSWSPPTGRSAVSPRRELSRARLHGSRRSALHGNAGQKGVSTLAPSSENHGSPSCARTWKSCAGMKPWPISAQRCP